MNRFSKLTLSATTALSLALAPMPAAAEPGGQDIARALAGLAVLGIIAKSASNRDDRRRNSTINQNSRIPQLGSIDDRRNTRIIEGDLRRQQHSNKDKRGYKKTRLPDRCLRTIDTARNDRLVYVSRCLERSYKFARKLPQSCERFVRTNRGLLSVYASRCLARDGWKVARG